MAGRPLKVKYATQEAIFNALTGVANTTEYITTSSAHGFSNGDLVRYIVDTGNTAVTGLSNGTYYNVISANATALQLTTVGGTTAINITASVNQTGHTLQRFSAVGVQEMTDNDLLALAAPVVYNRIANPSANASATYGYDYIPYTVLRTALSTSGIIDDINNNTAELYGHIYDTYPATSGGTRQTVGDHPTVNNGYQGVDYVVHERVISIPGSTSTLIRPLYYDTIGNETVIRQMSDQQIKDNVIQPIVQRMHNYSEVGSYFMGPTLVGPPANGTWVVRTSLTDSYANTLSNNVQEGYSLWQKTGPLPVLDNSLDAKDPISYPRPLKQVVTSGVTKLVEMSNADIITWLDYILPVYIRDTGIGKHQAVAGAPVGSGTWISKGSFVDKVNVITEQVYQGNYSLPYTQTWSRAYTNTWSPGAFAPFTGPAGLAFQYNRTFTGPTSFVGRYNALFTGDVAYTPPALPAVGYTGAAGPYSLQYTNIFSRSYTGTTGGTVYTSPGGSSYTKNVFTGTWTRVFAADIYTRIIPDNEYTQHYTALFAGLYTSIYTLLPVYTGTGPFQYSATFTNVFTSLKSRVYSALYTMTIYYGGFAGGPGTTYGRAWTGPALYTGTFANSYVSYFTGTAPNVSNYTGVSLFTQIYTYPYTNSFAGTWTGVYTRQTAYTQGRFVQAVFTGPIGYTKGYSLPPSIASYTISAFTNATLFNAGAYTGNAAYGGRVDGKYQQSTYTQSYTGQKFWSLPDNIVVYNTYTHGGDAVYNAVYTKLGGETYSGIVVSYGAYTSPAVFTRSFTLTQIYTATGFTGPQVWTGPSFTSYGVVYGYYGPGAYTSFPVYTKQYSGGYTVYNQQPLDVRLQSYITSYAAAINNRSYTNTQGISFVNNSYAAPAAFNLTSVGASFVGRFTRAYTLSQQQPYTAVVTYTGSNIYYFVNQVFVQSYTKSYSTLGVGTGYASSSYLKSYSTQLYVTYTGVFSSFFASVFTREYNTPYSAVFNNAFTGLYNQVYSNVFANTFTAGYTKLSGSGTTTYTQVYTSSYTSSYTQNYTSEYTGTFTQGYTQGYTQQYTRTWSQQYTKVFTSRSPTVSSFNEIVTYYTASVFLQSYTREPYTLGAFTTTIYTGSIWTRNVYTGATGTVYTGAAAYTRSVYTASAGNIYTGALSYTGVSSYAGTLAYTGVLPYTGTLSYTGVSSYAGTLAYTGVSSYTKHLVYTGNLIYTGTLVYTGAAAWTGNPLYTIDVAYTVVPGFTGVSPYTVSLLYSGTPLYTGVSPYTKEPVFTGAPGYTGSQVYTGASPYTGAPVYVGVATYTGAPLYTGTLLYTGLSPYTQDPIYTGTLGYVGTLVYTGAAPYTGAPIYTGAPGYTGSLLYTGSRIYTISPVYTSAIFTGPRIYTNAQVFTKDLIYTGPRAYTIIYTGPSAYTGTPLYTGPLAYTGAPSYTGPSAYTGTPLYTGPLAYTGAPSYTGGIYTTGTGIFTGADTTAFTTIYTLGVAYTSLKTATVVFTGAGGYSGAFTLSTRYTGATDVFTSEGYTLNARDVFNVSYTKAFTLSTSYASVYVNAFTKSFAPAATYGLVWTRVEQEVINESYLNPYPGVFYTSSWTGSYTSRYAGSGGYTRVYTLNNVYTLSYTVGAYSRIIPPLYFGGYVGGGPYYLTYTKEYTRTFTVNGYTGAYTSASGAYSRTVVYANQYTAITREFFANPSYLVGYTSLFKQSYLTYGTLLQSYTATSTGSYAGFQGNVYASGSFTGPGQYGYYQGVDGNFYIGRDLRPIWANVFTGRPVVPQYTLSSIARTYTTQIGYARGIYTGTFTSQYTRPGFTQNYTRLYTSSFTKTYSGEFTGLTVQIPLSSTTYILYVRVQ